MSEGAWSVYIIRATDGSLYTGITTDVARRFREHDSGRGARFFRGRKPEAVVHVESGYDRAGASRREAAIKQMGRVHKLALLQGPSGTAPAVPCRGE